jgi:hypothetical protein
MLLPAYDASTYGLVWLAPNSTAVNHVPLLGVSVQVDVVDFCSRTCITQQFASSASTDVNAVYVFPLDERAAVCGFEADIDGYVMSEF